MAVSSLREGMPVAKDDSTESIAFETAADNHF
jgi:hypothetical protein